MDWRQNIKDLREDRGMSQGELDELSGLPQGTVMQIESGSPFYNTRDVDAIADALEISLEKLVGSVR
jgi:transcriptional regulator with XRE-family HTH domain